MPDDKNRLHPPQWLGRPILHDEHLQDLETRAAVHEFHGKLPRAQAEQQAHDDYVKEHREKAASHHLAGMRAAQATGNHEDARKHWAMYDLHCKALGKESVGAVPPEIEAQMQEKPVYKFKAHKGDLYALHQPSKDVAPPEGQPIQKAEGSCKDADGYYNHSYRGNGRHCVKCKQTFDHCEWCGDRVDHKRTPRGSMTDHLCSTGNDGTKGYSRDGKRLKKDEVDLEKAEAGQCKWRLGERRCQRKVTTQYCHDHVDHWANRIKQKEAASTPPAELGKEEPTWSCEGCKHKVPDKTIKEFECPKCGGEMNQDANHPDYYVKEQARVDRAAGKRPSHLKVVKADDVMWDRFTTLYKAAKLVLALKKGDVIKFPGNPAPAVDQGKKAPVSGLVPKTSNRRDEQEERDYMDWNHEQKLKSDAKVKMKEMSEGSGYTFYEDDDHKGCYECGENRLPYADHKYMYSDGGRDDYKTCVNCEYKNWASEDDQPK